MTGTMMEVVVLHFMGLCVVVRVARGIKMEKRIGTRILDTSLTCSEEGKENE